MRLVLERFHLDTAEKLMCVEALATAGSIVEAAQLLGITRHALKRRIIKHRIEWPRSQPSGGDFEAATVAAIELANFEPINVNIEPVFVNIKLAGVEMESAGVKIEPAELVCAEMEPAQLEPAQLEPAQKTQLDLIQVVPNPKMARVSRAFSWLAILTPKRIWNEDVGDAVEALDAMERAGCSRFKVRLKIVSTHFWVLIAVIRELVAALTGRKSPHK